MGEWWGVSSGGHIRQQQADTRTGLRTSIRDEAGGDPGGGLLLLQPVQGGAGGRQGGVERDCKSSQKSLGRGEEVDSKPAADKEGATRLKLHPSFLEDAKVRDQGVV